MEYETIKELLTLWLGYETAKGVANTIAENMQNLEEKKMVQFDKHDKVGNPFMVSPSLIAERLRTLHQEELLTKKSGLLEEEEDLKQKLKKKQEQVEMLVARQMALIGSQPSNVGHRQDLRLR